TWPVLDDGYALTIRPGPNQFMMVIRPDRDGYRRFYFRVFRRNTQSPASHSWQRSQRRLALMRRALAEVDAAPHQIRMAEWEALASVWVPQEYNRYRYAWVPGCEAEFASNRFATACNDVLAEIAGRLARMEGLPAQALTPYREMLETWVGQARKPEAAWRRSDPRAAFLKSCALRELMTSAATVISIRLAVEDHIRMFKDAYPQGHAARRQIDARSREIAEELRAFPHSGPDLPERAARQSVALDALRQTVLLDTPLLAFNRVLLARGSVSFNSNWGGANQIGDELAILSPVAPSGSVTRVHKGTVSDFDLHWDGRRVLFSDRKILWELDLQAPDDPPRRITDAPPDVWHYDGCYLPDGGLLAVCNACYQAVPCTGEANVGNLHRMDADGRNERRIAFDQDHNWNPTVMHDGRVLYTRWEYADIPHYFSRFLMRMNPDGSGQMEYYGSGSYWPNAMYWPRPIPGDPHRVVCIVSGHHGVSRAGEVILLDPRQGRHEASGVVQRLPGYGQTVEPVIKDQLVSDVWPRYAAPYPLAEGPAALGAGRYFLVCRQRNAFSGWDLCLIDIFDNVTPIKHFETLPNGQFVNYMSPVPLRARPQPPVIPSQCNPSRKDAVIYLSDIYSGQGLRGYPRGSIKALRVGTHHYRYFGNGFTYAHAFEGGWDVKRILGTVPVHEDGSAFFRVPANTPIFVQPLDAEGKAQQQMRSWYTAMPGETAACIGCHEPQNSVPPVQPNLAARGKPVAITPWQGPVRGFSFEHEIQPILSRRCVGCHQDKPLKSGSGGQTTMEDFRDKRLQPHDPSLIPPKCEWWWWLGSANKHLKEPPLCFSPAYMRLQKYVRRAGLEADLHLLAPAEFEADTSELVQRLKKGHHGVTLTQEEWEALYTWIDFNVPYCGTWRESNLPPNEKHVRMRAEYKKRYAGLEDRDEEGVPLPPIPRFEPPSAPVAKTTAAPQVDGWPMNAGQATAAQRAAGEPELTLDLGGGISMRFALIPAGTFVMGRADGFADEAPRHAVAIDKPFYLGVWEVTCEQYARFNARHESGYIEGRNKDRTTRGTFIGSPRHPVVRISWREAMAFCAWLSRVSGRTCTLPTEAQWEWACRAGSDADFAFGPALANHQANLADEGIRDWNYGRAQTGYQDGARFSAPVGRYKPNVWGLYDMHGNVAEWTRSAYRPYPCDPSGDEDEAGLKVVRGGSWNDTMAFAGSASRWRYAAWQPVYQVGFRVLVVP
ncbi:MAG TPA: SUMF1/EgtB/PvdO family nonheme iron enzyme, partial [Kiritimatiellia bacterium]|nr:SUMF1/EgtB/PvdO family nonheme iron enzyme [Kiritimatiellia bacterium]